MDGRDVIVVGAGLAGLCCARRLRKEGISSGGPFVCGDHRENASINGVMVSGRKTADAVLASLRG